MDFGTVEKMFKMPKNSDRKARLQIISTGISTSTCPNETWTVQAIFILYIQSDFI